MENLERCVEKLDLRSTPQFVDDVSGKHENEASRHFAISLYAELARLHKQAVIPFIPRMMASIVRSLPFSADSQQLHESCAKVVTSVARYTIDPTRSYDSNQQILCDLCLPLLPVLSSKLESAAAGAAICLQALVESEKWKFAPLDLQESICSRATVALRDQGTQAVSFCHLVKSLVKFSTEVSKRYLAEWLDMVLEVLQTNTVLWQKHLAAAQLVTIILKTAKIDDELGIDLDLVIESLDAHRLDKIAVVQMAVAEALEIAQGMILERQLQSASGKLGSIDIIFEDQTNFVENKEPGLRAMSNPASPRSGASSQESVPSMASSRVTFGTEPIYTKQQLKNDSHLPSLNGRLMQTSMYKDKSPGTIPRRVLSEIPLTGKKLSKVNFLPKFQKATSLRSLSMDLGSEAHSHSRQNQPLVGSRKPTGLSEHVCMYDRGERAASLVNRNYDGSQIIRCRDSQCTVDLGKKSEPLEAMVEGQSDNSSKNGPDTDEDLDEQQKGSLKSSTEGSSDKRKCLKADSTTSNSDGEVRNADSRFLVENINVEGKTEDSRSCKEGHHPKAKSPSQDCTFKASCTSLDSAQRKDSATDMRQSCKQCSDCDIQTPREHCWTSDSVASGNSEQGGSVSGNFQTRNPSSSANCGMPDMCEKKRCRLNSYPKRYRRRNSCDAACSFSSGLSNDSEDGASRPSLATKRVSPGKNTVKVNHGNAGNNVLKRNNETGSNKHCFGHLQMKTGLPVRPDTRFRDVHYSGIESVVSPCKSQRCGDTILRLFCAVGVLVLAFVVIHLLNLPSEPHVMVPT